MHEAPHVHQTAEVSLPLTHVQTSGHHAKDIAHLGQAEDSETLPDCQASPRTIYLDFFP